MNKDEQFKMITSSINEIRDRLHPHIFETAEPYVDLIKIVADFVNPSVYPFISGDDRSKWLCNRLIKFHVKYMDDI